MSIFIFDFDGTLADTFPLVVDVTYELSGIPHLPRAEVDKLRGLPLLSAVMALGVRVWQVPKLIFQTRRHMFSRMDTVPIFPGVGDVLRELAGQGHRLYILTSNHQRNVEVFLRKHRLDGYFEDIVGVYYGNAFYKMYGLHKLLARHKLRKDDCYYVGNEPLDIQAARGVGMRSIAVAWSGHDHNGLAQAGPFAIIDKPKELLGFR